VGICILLLVIGAIGVLVDNSDTRPKSAESPALAAEDFINAGKKTGYNIIVDEDYDGYATYWAGAYKFPEGVWPEKHVNQVCVIGQNTDRRFVDEIHVKRLYVIDYTLDRSLANARIEFNKDVAEMEKEVGGRPYKETGRNDSGQEYTIYSNSSDKKFGVSFIVGAVNLHVLADAEYKPEILRFFSALGYEAEPQQK